MDSRYVSYVVSGKTNWRMRRTRQAPEILGEECSGVSRLSWPWMKMRRQKAILQMRIFTMKWETSMFSSVILTNGHEAGLGSYYRDTIFIIQTTYILCISNVFPILRCTNFDDGTKR